MSFLKAALDLAERGFHVFPLIPNSKFPLIDDFPRRATRDLNEIRSWWLDPVLGLEQPFNIGISTTRFAEKGALVAIDVDNKGEKRGNDELEKLKTEGCEFPATFEQLTPSGGRHIVYRTQEPLKQGTDVLGKGLDIRSRGGYLVGAGSCIEGRSYSERGSDLVYAPDWLVSRCGRVPERKSEPGPALESIDQVRAKKRALEYIKTEAPLANAGEGGDQTTFRVACHVKDFGVPESVCLALLEEEWNPRCDPPWELAVLEMKVENAYRYGHDSPGVAAPETQFSSLSPVDEIHPFDKLNQKYAYMGGKLGFVLHETKDENGKFQLEFIPVPTFYSNLAPLTMNYGGKNAEVARLWLRSPRRRQYAGFCFAPAKDVPPHFYNLWRGFSVTPLGKSEKPSRIARGALDSFLEHARENVCNGSPQLTQWLIGYFAHLVQKPFEKPLTALVFRGKKGVGKNALVERIEHLLSAHAMVVSDPRYLTGNFNSHLENKLLIILDEAFWSGDKRANGMLKHLVTGKRHVIEQKGKEPFSVENLTRVAILGNEDWLVPATGDERRYAVFNVGEGRMQDKRFFSQMRIGMESGGYPLLLRYLLDFDLTTVDVDEAPDTEGLRDQKEQSLEPFDEWWLECLRDGCLFGSDFSPGWQREIPKKVVYDSFAEFCRKRNIRGRLPAPKAVGVHLRRRLPSVEDGQRRAEGLRVHTYRVPDLEVARIEWDKSMRQKFNWPPIDETDDSTEEIFR